jgi:hypothetical protein
VGIGGVGSVHCALLSNLSAHYRKGI